MKKIMLVIEDYSENNRTQLVLKKIGFDVLSMQTSTGLVEKLLGFNPDVVIAFGTQKFSSLSIGQRLKEMHHLRARSIIVLQPGERPHPSELSKLRMDVLMEAPLMPEKLIEVICNLTGLEAVPIIDKLRKAHLTDPALAGIKLNYDAINKKSGPFQDTVRSDKYKKIIDQLPAIEMKKTTFVKNELKECQEEMEKDWDQQLTESINELKKQFVEALYRKKGE